MRIRVTVLAVVLSFAAALAVVAAAQTSAKGLPSYTDGYTKWAKLNRKPVTTPGAHDGIKNVYASKTRSANRRFPNGTVIVKSIAEPGANGLPHQVAVMRKLAGRWRWVEYALSGSRYTAFASGQVCTGCHVQAKANDWVFTRR